MAVALVGCTKGATTATANGDASATRDANATSPAKVEPSRYATWAQWGKGDLVWVQTTNAVFVLDTTTKQAKPVASFEADIRQLAVADDADAFVVLLRNGEARFGTTTGAPRTVPVGGGRLIAISKNGSVLAVDKHEAATGTITTFLDAPALVERGRVPASVSFVDKAGEIAASDDEVFATREGKSLEKITGDYHVVHTFEARVAFFSERELVVFDADKRATVRLPASCARKPKEPELGNDAFHDRTKRAARYCHDHVIVFDVGTLARTVVEIPNAPPRTQEGGFPWFGGTELSFAKGSDDILFSGSGYEHEVRLVIDPKKKTVIKVKDLPPVDDGMPTRGDLTLEWSNGVVKVTDRNGGERASFGDPSARAPERPKKPTRKPKPASSADASGAGPR